VHDRNRYEWGFTREGDQLAWYRRTERPEPTTLDELERYERGRENAAAREREAKAEARAERRKAPPARAVVLGDAEPGLGAVTLRGLGERVEQLGGVLVIERDGLTIRASGKPGPDFVTGARALYSAEAAILFAVEGKPGAIDPAVLPDRELLPSGRLLPAALQGRGR
jgi:hypothetical protein